MAIVGTQRELAGQPTCDDMRSPAGFGAVHSVLKLGKCSYTHFMTFFVPQKSSNQHSAVRVSLRVPRPLFVLSRPMRFSRKRIASRRDMPRARTPPPRQRGHDRDV